MMNTDKAPSKLSLLAGYDDMCRFSNSIQFNDMHKFIALLKNFEEVRKKWAQALKDISERDALILKLQSEAHDNNIRVQSLRMAYAREVKAKESLQRDFNDLKKKMELVRELMMEEKNPSPSVLSSRSHLMSVLNNFDQNHTDDDSNDGLLFDKSDDNIDLPKESKIPKMDYTIDASSHKKQAPKSEIQRVISKTQQFSTIDEVSDEGDSIFNTGFIVENDKANEKQPSPSSKGSVTKVKLNGLNRRLSTQVYSRMNLLRYNSKLEPDRLDCRGHKFQEKKAFKPQNCTVCTKSIGFCTAYLACTECRGVAHNRCRELLPKPCLPYVSGQSVRKMISSTEVGLLDQNFRSKSCGKLLIIGDFTNMDIRPCVPALLVHCCNEVDRRIQLASDNDTSLVGLYRICTVDREVRELRNKILEAKHGIPNLTAIIDIHIICGAVKMFLRDLEDSLLTTVLWHDFVRAAEHVVDTKPKYIDNGSDLERPDSGLDDSQSDSENDPIQVLIGVIMHLPVANRDSLAFLMLHLRNVANAERVTKMNIAALANIFAPTIVGNSEFRQLSSSSLMRENSKQVLVMNALFLIEEQFWKRLLKDKDFSPFKENRDTISLMNDAAAMCSKLAKISSSNLKSLLNNNAPIINIHEISKPTCKPYQNGTIKTNSPNKMIGKKIKTDLKGNKRSSIEYIRQTLY